ncbi:hypothetical protein [Nonomuraea sp. B19D2]|uniref:hypothetical protein n=1 Tax=Nonomuraea sp. B19D2 TaxID=3159561 RepID=UPI0032DB0A8E
MQFPGGQIDLQVMEQQAREEVESLVQQASADGDPDARKEAIQELAHRAEDLGALTIINRGPWVEIEADPHTERQWNKLAEWILEARDKRQGRPPNKPSD